ncbi:MAG: plastocyanin/azurin family copper-binding protein [Chloroflexota bacterium]
MFTSLRTLTLLVIIGLATACTTGARPAWTYSPASPSGSPSSQPSGQPSGQPSSAPTTDPQGSGDDLPILTPKADLAASPAGEVNVAYAPNVPAAATRTSQAIVDVHFDVVEGVQAIDPNGLEYMTWGYRLHGDSTVTTGTPGPIIRARVGDILRFTLTNGGTMPHNVDFHAVTGQGGGAKDLTVAPGETATIEARMLYPGMFLYHCAAGDVPLHISEGMYGGILVDPETPLPAVEHELYMVQSEYYTTDPAAGPLTTDRHAITDETPTFVVFNGAKGSLTGDNAPKMQVGEKMRIYFVDAGLNLDSNFHPIGSHWDKVWEDGGLLNAPLRGLQTVLVPAGGATIVELDAWVPMTVVLVDHALARAFDKGAIGQIVITGDDNPEIFEFTGLSGLPAPTMVPATSTPGASATPQASATAPASPGEGYQVSIVAGASTYQPADAADEFADSESPADYSTNVLMVPLGATVTWTNNDPGMTHTVTAVDGSFDSGNLAAGQAFSYTFDNPGTFEYACTPHPWMRGRIEVMMH